MKISWLWLGMMVAALTFLAACGGAQQEAPEPEPEAVAAAAVEQPPQTAAVQEAPPAVVEQVGVSSA